MANRKSANQSALYDTTSKAGTAFMPTEACGGPGSITHLQMVEAFQTDLGYLRTRVSELENRVRRYDRLFETFFKEELDRRINGKENLFGEDCRNAVEEVGALEKLKWQARGR